MDDKEKQDLEAQHNEDALPQAYLDLAAADTHYTSIAESYATVLTAFNIAQDSLKEVETAFTATITARQRAQRDVLKQAPNYKARDVLRTAFKTTDRVEPKLKRGKVDRHTTSTQQAERGGTCGINFLTGIIVLALVVLLCSGHYNPAGLCGKSRLLAKAYNYFPVAFLLSIPVFLIGLILATNSVAATLARCRPKRYALVVFFTAFACLYLIGAAAIPERMNNIIVFEPFCHTNEWVDVYSWPGHPGWEGYLEEQRSNRTATEQTKERIRMWDESELARNISRMYRESKGWTFGKREWW